LPRKSKPRLPTVDEFLHFKPKRLLFEWDAGEDGLVRIKVPKFTSTLGQSFCTILKKDNMFTAHLDSLGSLVWKQCDGKHTVKQILKTIQTEFPKEKNIDQRLFLFILQMGQLHYVEY
jgi:hypothetical protein